MHSDHQRSQAPAAARRRSGRLRLIVAATLGGLLFSGCVGVAVESARLMVQDHQAFEMARVLAARIRSRDPQFKDVVDNVHSWHNGQTQPATATERVWNRLYPAIVGKVRNQAEFIELQDLIRATCKEHQYDPEMVIFVVRIEP